MRLSIDNVVFKYDSVTILDGITFNVEQGRITGIIGPNGSGKTTLLRCMANTLKPEQGAVLIDEKNVLTYKRKDLAKFLSVVPQITRLETGFTVFETTLLGRYPHQGLFQRETEKDYRVVKSVLSRVGIGHLANRDVSELSGGEKQLVSIALALSQEPRVLLLDEPTLHLDINMQYKIMKICREICREEKIVIVIVIHDLILASHFCDDLIILKNGRILTAGPVDGVINEKTIRETYQTNVIIGRDGATGLKYIVPDYRNDKNIGGS
ncbi:MAG: ABC transporter ATP-binding protein [Candidatus Hodarchaeales archaeon]